MRNDDWTTRHTVLTMARRTAALVNLLGETPAPDAVVALLREYGEREMPELTAEDVAAMGEAAERLRPVFAATEASAAAVALNQLLAEHTTPPRLSSHGGTTPWHLHLDSADDAPWGEWFLASSCLALTVLVWDRQRPPGGPCASSTCRNVFIAVGQGPRRHYCSRQCATRERVAAHRRALR